MALLGVDVGTTFCKCALFEDDGTLLRPARRPTPTRHTPDGLPFYDPDGLWALVASAIREVVAGGGSRVSAVGVSSMAEAGLLVDAGTGEPRSHIIPWYDSRSAEQAEAVGRLEDPLAAFRRSGLHASYKYGISKILWLRDSDPDIVDGAKWLSVSDYIVFRLTGHIVTDPSLAARTYAYRIVEERWDQSLLDRLGLDEALFPTVLPAGEPAGSIEPAAAADTGLPRTATAAVAGHDHICALFAAGIMEPGQVLDSIGTAESLLGVIALSELGENELRSGLVIVPHLLPGRFCWLGGLRSAGGSVEWIRGQLAVEALSYEDAIDLAEQAGDEPTGILYFPYLTGRGGVCPDEHIRAAFVGLDASHGRPHLIKAVLEGTSYESESIRRAAERLSERPVDELIAVGGGTMNRPWMQVKADVTGCRVSLPPIAEASTLGAALAAGLRRGVIGGEEDITRMAASVMRAGEVIEPDAGRHAAYRRLYEGGYEAFGSALRRLSHDMIGTSRSYAWGGR